MKTYTVIFTIGIDGSIMAHVSWETTRCKIQIASNGAGDTPWLALCDAWENG